MKTFPSATENNPRHTYQTALWPYMEQQVLYNRYDQRLHFYLPPNTITNSLIGPVSISVPYYLCPTDSGAALYDQSDPYWNALGNYVVNWGNWTIPSSGPTGGKGAAPFGYNDPSGQDETQPRYTKIASMLDGTSNTLLMAEVRRKQVAAEWDGRGQCLNDDQYWPSARFMTVLTPNTSAPDVMGACGAASSEMSGAPCTTGGARYVSARSLHPAGVNVLLADGSVRFIGDAVNLVIWQAAGTMNAGDSALQLP